MSKAPPASVVGSGCTSSATLSRCEGRDAEDRELLSNSSHTRKVLGRGGRACDIEAGGEKKVVEELWHRREHVCNERARERHLCQGRDDDEGDGLEEQVPLLAIAPLGHPVEGPQEYDGGTEQRHYRPDMLADVIEGVQLGDQRENVQDEGGEDHLTRGRRGRALSPLNTRQIRHQRQSSPSSLRTRGVRRRGRSASPTPMSMALQLGVRMLAEPGGERCTSSSVW